MNLTETRLRREREQLEAFARQTPWLEVVDIQGNPPRSYHLRFKCRSITRLDSGRPQYGTAHELRIDLPANFPFASPTARVLTPICNPHVFAHGGVCLGSAPWQPGETLTVFADRLRRILVWDPLVLDPRSPANRSAMQWAQAHMRDLPLDSLNQAPQKQSGIKAWREIPTSPNDV
jgi:ubiquitin-protein ligase